MQFPISSKVFRFFLYSFLFGGLCLAGSSPVFATTSGWLDTSFHGTGWVITPSDRVFFSFYGLAVQPDGKIVTTGSDSTNDLADAVVCRYLPDGTLDTSFGGTGKVRTSIANFRLAAFAVAIQTDGKIVIAGGAYGTTNKIFLARYNAEGTLDNTFNGIGTLTLSIGTFSVDEADALAIRPDGKIVVAGTSMNETLKDFAVLRFNANGSLDTTFGGTGFVITDVAQKDDIATATVLQPDGKVVVAGYSGPGSFTQDFAVFRYNADGSLDTTFNGAGKVITPVGDFSDYAFAVAVQADGKIIAAGKADGSPSAVALVRYNANGTLDSTFHGTGKLITPVGENSRAAAIRVQADGRILVSGEAAQNSRVDLLALRYLPDGTADTTFNGTGRTTLSLLANTYVYAMVLQADSKILVAGNASDTSNPVRYSGTIVRYLGTPVRTLYDYDGDGKADVSVFRPSSGEWYILRSQDGLYGVSFGANGDKVAPADYDGDGKTDVAVYRPSNNVWYVLNSGNSTVSYYVFGVAEDLPTPADYDGDGKADLSVFRPSTGTWYRLNSHDNSFFAYQFGQNGDKPAMGDFDGDGKADISIFRPSDGSWYRVNSANGQLSGTQFGASGDLITPADYDGDGKTDIALFRPSVALWFRLNSSTGAFAAVAFGAATDIPAPGDFDGDGKADVSVFRPSDGNWYRLNSSNNAFVAQPFGANGDLPTPAAFRY